LGLSLPWDKLALARSFFPQDSQSQVEGLAQLNHCLQQLAEAGISWAAALVAGELARWHLGQGRIQAAFQLLNPYKGVDDWAVRWSGALLFAEAFCRMGRLDLARNSLEQATAIAPKPLSPVLVGEVRLLSARLLSAAGESEQVQVQLREARDIFRAAGDGVRLGRYLLLAAEGPWRQEFFEEARNLLGRALDIFRRYHDGLGAREAQLKLGLVLNEAPLTVLFP